MSKGSQYDPDFGIDLGCMECRLGETRNRIVIGGGNPKADYLFVGEAPGKNEDETGKPFAGAAGKLLDEMLERAGLTRDEIYITSVCKCRPPKNRNPKPDEIAACYPNLLKQIEVIKPKCIFTLGSFAIATLTSEKRSMAEWQGMRPQVEIGDQEYLVHPLYHPAAVIYNRKLYDTFLESGDEIRTLIEG